MAVRTVVGVDVGVLVGVEVTVIGVEVEDEVGVEVGVVGVLVLLLVGVELGVLVGVGEIDDTVLDVTVLVLVVVVGLLPEVLLAQRSTSVVTTQETRASSCINAAMLPSAPPTSTSTVSF